MLPSFAASTAIELDTQIARSRYKTERIDSVTGASAHDCHDLIPLIGLDSRFCFNHAVTLEMKQAFSITGGDFEVLKDEKEFLCCKGVF